MKDIQMLQLLKEYFVKSISPIMTCAFLELIFVTENNVSKTVSQSILTSFDTVFTFFFTVG